MDSQYFRKATYPTFSPIINEEVLAKAAKRIEAPEKKTFQVEDTRYPGYSAIMSDARLITDYKSQCANNVAPSSHGNSLRHWLQHNTSAFIEVSRRRQADRSGANYYMADTVLGQKYFQKCDEQECSFSSSGVRSNIGLGRREVVPDLFGTFSEARDLAPTPRNPKTTVFEGGRNTPRGREFTSLGNQSFNPRNSQYGSSG
jgi:hypothetical protein